MNIFYAMFGIIMILLTLYGIVIFTYYLELFWLICDPIPFKFCGIQLNKNTHNIIF